MTKRGAWSTQTAERMLRTEQETADYLRERLRRALPWERRDLEESLEKTELNLRVARRLAS